MPKNHSEFSQYEMFLSFSYSNTCAHWLIPISLLCGWEQWHCVHMYWCTLRKNSREIILCSVQNTGWRCNG